MSGKRPVELLVEACERALPLLRSPALGQHWMAPSALAEWSNSGLAGHLARSAFNLERALALQLDSGQVLDSVAAYYTASGPESSDSAIGRRIRELGDEEAAGGQAALADRFAASINKLRTAAVPLPPTVFVEMFRRVLPIDECATACLLELVVHSDDLAVSLGVPTPEFDAAAMDLVSATLCRISRVRHGELAVLRALSRAERAPAGGVSAFAG